MRGPNVGKGVCAVTRRRFPVGASPTRRFAPAGSARGARCRSRPLLCCVTRVTERDAFRGRDAHYWAPPAQIHTCGFPACGSYLGWLTAKRRSGHG
jgi:hypothetical protein